MDLSTFDYQKRSSDEELTFNDWQIVEQSTEQSDDDDSIEVIEREVLASLPSLTSSDSEESENEEQFKDFTNEVDEEVLSENRIQTIVPLNQCHSCASSVRRIDGRSQVSSSITSKVLYSFTLGVITSLIFQHYKSCIAETMASLSFGNELNMADMYFSFSFTHAGFFSGKYYSPMVPSSQEQSGDDSLAHLRSLFEKEKIALDNILTKQLNLLKHARRLQNDTYVFEISELAPDRIRNEDLIDRLKIEKPIQPCEDNITSEQLPLICQNDHLLLVYVKESQIISMSDTIVQFFSDVDKRVNTWQNLLTESAQSEGMDRDTNKFIFIQDCDHFSKPHKSSSHCVGSNWYCQRTSDVKKFTRVSEIESSEYWYLVKSKFLKKKLSEGDSFTYVDDTVRTKKDSHLCRCTASMMEIDEFENLSESNRYSEHVEILSEEEQDVDGDDSTRDERNEPMSGEWIFDLHEARAKLRNYYDSITSGHWFVKLGQARERLRESQDKNNRFQDDEFDKHDKVKKEYRHQNWYKKNGEKFKLKFRSLLNKWKQQLKSAKESITDKFRELKSKLKNRFRK